MQIRLLDATGQTGAALAEATRLEATARHDKELGELIISLQIKSGQRGEALARRQRMQQEAPGDVGNATALAELFLDNANPVQAEEVLKKLEATGTNARLAFLRGRSLADRGQMDKAKEEFEGLIKASSVGGKPGVGPYLVYAQFFMNYNRRWPHSGPIFARADNHRRLSHSRNGRAEISGSPSAHGAHRS